MGAFVNFFASGGSWMWAILLTLILAVAIIIERFIVLNFKNRIDSTAFVSKILELIQRGNIANAVELCSMSQAALPRITRAGLEEYMKNPT
ncbi:flagellar motor protein MotA, partial [candidate division KSB1 bacterium]